MSERNNQRPFQKVRANGALSSLLFVMGGRRRYNAAITGIDPALYEAAEVDGAGTFRKIINITLPSIKPTIVMLLIMKLGSMVSIGFERPFVMGNTLVKEYSDVLSTFVYRLGLQGGKFSFATAAGVFQSVVSVLLLVIANVSAKALGEKGIW